MADTTTGTTYTVTLVIKTPMKKKNSFQLEQVELQGVAQLLLNLLLFSAWCWL